MSNCLQAVVKIVTRWQYCSIARIREFWKALCCLGTGLSGTMVSRAPIHCSHSKIGRTFLDWNKQTSFQPCYWLHLCSFFSINLKAILLFKGGGITEKPNSQLSWVLLSLNSILCRLGLFQGFKTDYAHCKKRDCKSFELGINSNFCAWLRTHTEGKSYLFPPPPSFFISLFLFGQGQWQ